MLVSTENLENVKCCTSLNTTVIFLQNRITAGCIVIQASTCKNTYFDGGCIPLPVIIVFNDHHHSMKKLCMVVEGSDALEKSKWLCE